MRVVGREEFLQLEDGTVYAKVGQHGIPGPLSQKVETVDAGTGPIDWWVRELGPSRVIDDDGAPLEGYELDESVTRDGMFDEADRFVVLEWEDLKSLSSALAWGMHACLLRS